MARPVVSAVSVGLVLVLWTCPVSAFLPHVAVEVTKHSHNRSTEGASGVKCTNIHRQCITGVECVNKTCVCPDGQTGNGQIECVDQGNLLCVVSADPHLHSFQRARADVDLPCRYRLTRYVTHHRTAKTPHAFCSVEVFATNELHMGQYYVRSVHISLGITDNGQQVHNQFEVKKYGVTDDKIYRFLAKVTKAKAVWGSSVHETINGVDVFPTFDDDNNFAVLYVPECGTRVKYRAYDRSRHRQSLLPGISIMAPNNSKYVKHYGFYPYSLCGTIEDDDLLYVHRATELNVTDKNLAIIYDVLNVAAPQHGNPKKEECEAAIEAFQNSTDKAGDLNFCGFTLTKPQTRRCIVAFGSQPIEVFTACLNVRQAPSPDDCSFLSDVRASCGDKWNGPDIDCFKG